MHSWPRPLNLRIQPSDTGQWPQDLEPPSNLASGKRNKRSWKCKINIQFSSGSQIGIIPEVIENPSVSHEALGITTQICSGSLGVRPHHASHICSSTDILKTTSHILKYKSHEVMIITPFYRPKTENVKTGGSRKAPPAVASWIRVELEAVLGSVTFWVGMDGGILQHPVLPFCTGHLLLLLSLFLSLTLTHIYRHSFWPTALPMSLHAISLYTDRSI